MKREIKFRAWNDNTQKWIEKIQLHSDSGKLVGINHAYKNIHVMQYTGLKDRGGNEIYEDDIIRVIGNDAYRPYYHEAIQVVYSDRFAEFKCAAANSLSHYVTLGYNFEIIGNIHENPKLI